MAAFSENPAGGWKAVVWSKGYPTFSKTWLSKRESTQRGSRSQAERLRGLFGEPGRNGKRRGFEYKPVWRQIKIGLGVDNLRFPDLRHEAVSGFVEFGPSDQEVAAISDHRSM